MRVRVQGLRDLLDLTAAQRWPQVLRVAALQACFAAVPAADLPALAGCTAVLTPSEQLLAAARLGPHCCVDPYRGGGTRLGLRLWDACDCAFAVRVWKLTEKLAVAAGDDRTAPVRKVCALAVNGRPVTAWPQGLSRLDALRHLDWHAFLDAHAALLQLSAEPAPASAAASAPPSPRAAAAAPAPRAAVSGAGLRVAGKARGMASKARNAAAETAARGRMAAAAAAALQAARRAAPPRNVVEFELDSFTDEEVRRHRARACPRACMPLAPSSIRAASAHLHICTGGRSHGTVHAPARSRCLARLPARNPGRQFLWCWGEHSVARRPTRPRSVQVRSPSGEQCICVVCDVGLLCSPLKAGSFSILCIVVFKNTTFS